MPAVGSRARNAQERAGRAGARSAAAGVALARAKGGWNPAPRTPGGSPAYAARGTRCSAGAQSASARGTAPPRGTPGGRGAREAPLAPQAKGRPRRRSPGPASRATGGHMADPPGRGSGTETQPGFPTAWRAAFARRSPLPWAGSPRPSPSRRRAHHVAFLRALSGLLGLRPHGRDVNFQHPRLAAAPPGAHSEADSSGAYTDPCRAPPPDQAPPRTRPRPNSDSGSAPGLGPAPALLAPPARKQRRQGGVWCRPCRP